MNIKQSGELQGILDILKEMAKFETKIAELYALSAATWKEDSQFWLGIWRDEIRHARHVEQIMDIIRKEPQMFQAGRPCNVSTLAAVNREIEDKIVMIQNGEITKDQLLFAAQSLEQGYLEAYYTEIVVTDNAEYGRLIQEIFSGTLEHKDKIIQQIIDRAQNKGYIKE